MCVAGGPAVAEGTALDRDHEEVVEGLAAGGIRRRQGAVHGVRRGDRVDRARALHMVSRVTEA